MCILYNKHLLDFVFNFFTTLRTGISEKEGFRLRDEVEAVLVSAKTRDA